MLAVHFKRGTSSTLRCLLAYWSAHDSSFFLFASISFLIPIFTSNTCIVLFSAYNYNVLRPGVVYLIFFHALRLLFLVASSRPAATHPSVWIAYKKTRNVKQRAFDDESTTNRRATIFPVPAFISIDRGGTRGSAVVIPHFTLYLYACTHTHSPLCLHLVALFSRSCFTVPGSIAKSTRGD